MFAKSLQWRDGDDLAVDVDWLHTSFVIFYDCLYVQYMSAHICWGMHVR